jgi:manganese transport protein
VLSLQLGFAIIPLIHFNSDKKLMKEFTIKLWIKILAWISAAIIIYLNLHLVIDEIYSWTKTAGEYKFLIYGIVIPVALACFGLLLYVFLKPFFKQHEKNIRQLPHGEALDFKEEHLSPFLHIGITIDFSGNDQKIIINAMKQGGKIAKYTFIHVVETAAARYHGDKVMDQETLLDEQNLIKYQIDLEKLGYEADYKIGFGNTASAIAKIVIENEIDFLVMGAHGHKGFKDLLFGTTVDAVRHKIKIPVLIIN